MTTHEITIDRGDDVLTLRVEGEHEPADWDGPACFVPDSITDAAGRHVALTDAEVRRIAEECERRDGEMCDLGSY
jgi:hypothetical protein